MAKHQPEEIRFPKANPKYLNRFGYALIILSLLYGVVTHFLTYEHFAIQWGPYLAIPAGLLGLYFALQRRSQVLQIERKELIQVKEIFGFPIKKKPQSLQVYSRVRLSEDELGVDGKPIVVYRLFLEGKVAPAHLASFTDQNEANQRLKAIAKLVDLPISWPQV